MPTKRSVRRRRLKKAKPVAVSISPKKEKPPTRNSPPQKITPAVFPAKGKNQQNKRSGKKSIVITIVVAIIAAAAAGGGVYWWQKTAGEKLQEKVNKNYEATLQTVKYDLQSQIADLNARNCNTANTETLTVTERSKPVTYQDFANQDGKYSFKHPTGWKATASSSNKNNTFFGPTANGQTGLGGVEIVEYSGNLQQYIGSIAGSYTNQEVVTVNGEGGIRAHRDGKDTGEVFLLKKENKIFIIYIDSTDENDIKNFDTLMGSFKLF